MFERDCFSKKRAEKKEGRGWGCTNVSIISTELFFYFFSFLLLKKWKWRQYIFFWRGKNTRPDRNFVSVCFNSTYLIRLHFFSVLFFFFTCVFFFYFLRAKIGNRGRNTRGIPDRIFVAVTQQSGRDQSEKFASRVVRNLITFAFFQFTLHFEIRLTIDSTITVFQTSSKVFFNSIWWFQPISHEYFRFDP